MNPFAILCPGQGDQSPKMFELCETHAEAADFIKKNLDLSEISKDIFSNVKAQPLVVGASLANWLAIKDEIPKPNLIAGYSVGEITAYAVAGSFDPAQAVELAKFRALTMQACIDGSAPQAMMAVSGPSVSSVLEYVSKHGLYIAIQTSPTNYIIAGFASKLKLAEQELAKLEGLASLTLLQVHVASHTPLMKKASQEFADHLKKIKCRSSLTPVLAGISASRLTQSEEIKNSLAEQISKPLKWSECLDQLAEQGIKVALELGPGSALSKMLSDRNPQIQARSLADFRSLKGAIDWVNERLAPET